MKVKQNETEEYVSSEREEKQKTGKKKKTLRKWR